MKASSAIAFVSATLGAATSLAASFFSACAIEALLPTVIAAATARVAIHFVSVERFNLMLESLLVRCYARRCGAPWRRKSSELHRLNGRN
jgi:hypothetical protein